MLSTIPEVYRAYGLRLGVFYCAFLLWYRIFYFVKLACREVACPALDTQMDEAMGTIEQTGEPVYLRKLREEEAYG